MGGYCDTLKLPENIQTQSQLKKVIDKFNVEPWSSKNYQISNKTIRSLDDIYNKFKDIDKWGNGVAFKLLLPSKSKEKEIKELEEKLYKTQMYKMKFERKLYDIPKKSKQVRKKCKKCESYITLKYFDGIRCPVCNYQYFIMTSKLETEHKKIENDLKTIPKQIETIKKHPNKQNKFIWVLYACFPE